jgi:regulator of protease activity HflC (stomatin/prohibitin superfamily)
MTAERQKYIDQIQTDGELQFTKIKAEADGKAAGLVSDAEAQSSIILGQGEAEMMKSLAILQQNPNLATFNLQIAAMEQFLKRKTTLILDLSTSPLQWLQMAEPTKPDK